ncbi:hypothetical protein GCM10009546_31750 [Actinomadura livida]|uniref:Mycofactocin n=2 Tax=Actinomadura livida TaxID=79909 RepID=A0ABN1EI44_9ACTN|nr:hypothetical protein GCM10010208_31440 [Actinomadura livida]
MTGPYLLALDAFRIRAKSDKEALMDTNAPENQVADQADDAAREADVAESLIEEVSIDGMCGVY